MRRFSRFTIGLVVLTVVLGAAGPALAQTATAQARLTAVEYTGRDGLFVAFLSVVTTDKTLDATLALPNADAKGAMELHPIATYPLVDRVIFKFATKGKPIQTAGEVLEAVVVDPQAADPTVPVAVAEATCHALGSFWFVCR